MKRSLVMLLLMSSLSLSVYAKCGNNQTVFSCDTKKGKHIEVCDNKKTIEYSFGKIGAKPELLINVPRYKATTFQWHGIGRSETYSVDIPNDNAVYNVYWSVDKMSRGYPVSAGVNVSLDGAYVNTVECAKNIKENIVGIDLASTP